MIERPDRLDFDIHDTYAGRVPPRMTPVAPSAEWRVPAAVLRQEFQDLLPAIATLYVESPSEGIVLFRGPLAGDQGLLLQCAEFPRPDATEGHDVAFKLSCNGDSVCECIATVRVSDRWDLDHRWVAEQYRGQGIFSAAVDGMQSFVQAVADRMGRRQTVQMDAGQPMILARFYNKGFRPRRLPDEHRTREDEERFWRIIDGDPAFFCDYSYALDIASGAYVPNAARDVYCFEHGKADTPELRCPLHAVRVTMEQCYGPRFPEISLKQHATSASFRDALGH
ncbi:MAG: hypothetical protein Greene041619_397 [Candidatus Peregrinibacteria bacterium Greene0416_19]|nr:MAG: hypothetical protein Greene041619_397 [Candidatus Peregrinibacteria bacterium Greene0416_19]